MRQPLGESKQIPELAFFSVTLRIVPIAAGV